jgi:hypothetical protein
MKRHAALIVDYDSSGDESAQVEGPPPKKKYGRYLFLDSRLTRQIFDRKLPALSLNLVIPVPIDNPALHQGRTRTTSHVDGNWAAHVYVSIAIARSHALYSLLETVVIEAQRRVPTFRSFMSDQNDKKHQLELHISLTHPFFIRAHQKEELRRVVRKLAKFPG